MMTKDKNILRLRSLNAAQAAKFILVLLIFAAVSEAPLRAQQQTSVADDAEAPLLRLDDAISIALSNNRLVKNSSLEAQKYDFRLSTARSKRLPQFQIAVLGGELLHSFDFTFDPGAFGTYQNVGPIPGKTTKIHNPARFITYATGSVDQPLTQQYKIGLGIKEAELGRQIAGEDVRAEREKIAAEVRAAYYELVATQTGVEAARQQVTTLEEAQRVTLRYISEKTVLKSDALQVDAQLAKAKYELATAENGIATQQEHLNQLLGRDLATRFQVEAMPEEDNIDLTLAAARELAFSNRPEIRQARLKEKQAEVDRRIAKAEYIPDLSLSVRYQGLDNVRVLPANVATAGFYLSWEPFDWGRRRNNGAEKAKEVTQARNGTQETEAQIAVEVGSKYRKWQETALLLKAARVEHEAAGEQFRVTTNKYREQAALVKDVLQAQAQNTQTEFQYQQALSSYWSSLADLRRAMGEE